MLHLNFYTDVKAGRCMCSRCHHNVPGHAYFYCVSRLDLADTLSLCGKIPSSLVHPQACSPASPSLRDFRAAATLVIVGHWPVVCHVGLRLFPSEHPEVEC